MQIITNSCTNPYFNLAAEEFLLQQKDSYFMLWRNDKSVIIGKNQNAFAEINIDFVRENDIALVRRLTGGGAVFHDLGNINYSFITDDNGNGINFERFTEPICKALKNYGVFPKLSGRNDLMFGDRKISGNAQCVYNTNDGRKRLLHHGTLLFSADISYMSKALRADAEKLKSKGVKSVPSRVLNISDAVEYSGPENPRDFLSSLEFSAEAEYGCNKRFFTNAEIDEIDNLVGKKYGTWKWNFGLSPEYNATSKKRFSFGTVSVSLKGVHGVIEDIVIEGDFFGTDSVDKLCERLVGTPLIKKDITEKLDDIDKFILGASSAEIADLIIDCEVMI